MIESGTGLVGSVKARSAPRESLVEPAKFGKEKADEEDSSDEENSEKLRGFGVNAGIVQDIRERYETDPASVDSSWASFFNSNSSTVNEPILRRIGGTIPEASESARVSDPQVADKQARALRLIHAYRARGHRIADTDPLSGQNDYFPELDPAHYGFGADDMDLQMLAGDLPGGPIQPLFQILDCLNATYCRSLGIEFLHIQDPGRRQWLQHRMEESRNTCDLSKEELLRILEKLSAASLFERFLHTKFIGQKRFSLEGAESLIPLLDTLVEESPGHGVRELVLGMAHRGRLNVLSNILGKSLESIFSEFEDVEVEEGPHGSGDVKYHKGYSNDRRTLNGARIHLSLTANPSHLEAVDPVVEGRARAKQVRARDEGGHSIVPILLHGDAAFAGQGMVSETLNLSHLVGYSTGGTVHVIVNNQIGFTTTPKEARSTLYCTDAAKMVQAPIIHVNGDDPEAVVHSAKMALDYRQRFNDDVVIDMVCYRRHGHNEGDDPSFTQPLMYDKIRAMLPVRQKFTQYLVRNGLLSEEDVTRIENDLSDQLKQALQVIKTTPPQLDEPYEPRGPWSGFARSLSENVVGTEVPTQTLEFLLERLGSVKDDFEIHPKLLRQLKKRRNIVSERGSIDWATAESLAFASLLVEGTPIRLSGQDSSRGTFSQRHAVLMDRKTGEEYAPLANISEDQARFEVYDSHLSEAGVLGFEYGYSLADPITLTIWEAQFGDFANGAQVIIDQFISSAHAKWSRMSGLVMLLPHGYEGQGPEHSSCRLERFLQLCAEENMQVVNCTTPSQYFHVLRRQMKRSYRSPLIIATPKSLLRLPAAVSKVEDLSEGGFEPLIDDRLVVDFEDVERLVFCSGKIFYDLSRFKQERLSPGEQTRVAIVRIEQLYPWPGTELLELVSNYRNVEDIYWVQEEPANMGPWSYVRDLFPEHMLTNQKLTCSSRIASASTAVGSLRIHRQEQEELVTKAFTNL